MVYYAVIDTNVLVSALLTRHEDASPLQVVKRLFRGDIIPLLKTLHAIRTVQVPQAVVRPQLPETVQNQPLTIESITVNVERLEKEADYDAMAERVGEKIMERAMRGMAVGGLRLG